MSAKISVTNLSSAITIGALAGSPWLFQASYSRGYDYFLWFYNAHTLLENLLRGHWPNWTSISAAGSPLFKMGGLTDAVVFSAFIGSLGYDLGPRLYVFLVYCVSAIGIYCMVRLWDISHYSALVSVAAYVFSWFLTYTVDYTTYLSNFLLYALMPWGALCFVLALRRKSFGFLVLSSFLLFFAIAANAQVSIKFALFIVAVGLIDRGRKGCDWVGFLSYVGIFLFIAASLGAFIIVPAIDLKLEVVQLASYRSNIWVSPWMMLFGLPILGLYLFARKIGFVIDVDPKLLGSVIHSDYVGFSVLTLVIFGIWHWRKNLIQRRIVYILCLSLIVYFCVVPFLPNAAWIGSTHNWAVFHTFWFSILVGFGAEHSNRIKLVSDKFAIFSAICIGVILVELGGARILLNYFALKHESPYDLPEVGVWKSIIGKIGPYERLFTFNLNHTHYLFPVITSRGSIANIIELRTRKPAYDSYLRDQKNSMRRLDHTYNPSESLALLNVRFVDLPIQTFSYKGDINDYAKGIDLLMKDKGLKYVTDRKWDPLDDVYDKSIFTEKIDQLFSEKETHDYGQFIFETEKPLWGFVSNYTVAIVGDNHLECEKIFENITHIPGFLSEKILYVLLTKEEFLSLDDRVVGSFDGLIPLEKGFTTPSTNVLTIDDIVAMYLMPYDKMPKEINLERMYVNDEAIAVSIGKREKDRFLFLSQQHFSHWFAFTEEKSTTLPVFTSGAGLTAIWIPSDVKRLEYSYVVPINERLARIWSIVTMLFCCGIGVLSRLSSVTIIGPSIGKNS